MRFMYLLLIKNGRSQKRYYSINNRIITFYFTLPDYQDSPA